MGFVRTMINKHPKMMLFALKFLNRLPFRNRVKKKGEGNKIIARGLLKNCRIQIKGSGNTIIVGNFARLIKTKITIIGNNNIIDLSAFVYMNSGDLYIEDSNGRITVGEHTTFSGETHLACIEGKAIVIGKRCLFSSNITLRTGDSHSILNLDGKRINPSQDICIADRVWVGNSVRILKGVSIAEDSIIGTGAIVTKPYEQSNVILGGNPAKIIKEKIQWKIERIEIDD